MKAAADLIIKGKNIFTSETLNCIEGSIIIKDDTIIDIITTDDYDMYIGADTNIIDAGDGLVIPAFNDAHAHIFQAGMDLAPGCKVKLDGCADAEEVSSTIKTYAQTYPEKEWIFGGGWSLEMFDGKMPDISILDSAVPDRPVFMLSWDFHTAWVNTKALKVIGIFDDTEKFNNPGLCKDKDGNPTGIINELFAQDACRLAAESIDINMIIKTVCDKALSYGISAMSNVWPANGLTDEYILKAVLEHAEKGTLSIRMSMFPEMTEDLNIAKIYKEKLHGPYLRFGGVKNFMDGVCEAHTGYLTEPYADDPSTAGEPIFDYDKMYHLISNANAHGFPVRLHCIGNGAVKEALDIFEAVQKEQGNKGIHNALEHLETICPEDIKRFAKLGVVASMQPTHSILNIEGYPALLGEKWIPYMWPINSLIEENAIMAFGTDVPVYDLNPVHGLYVATQRKKPWDHLPNNGFVPEQSISLAKAIQAYTLGSAIAGNFDDKLGTLQPGKYADIAIFEKNLFDMPTDDLPDAKVVYTIVGGKIAYQMKKNSP